MIVSIAYQIVTSVLCNCYLWQKSFATNRFADIQSQYLLNPVQQLTYNLLSSAIVITHYPFGFI
jgi:hypothetical protein